MQKFAAIRRFRWPLTGALLGALVFVALYGVQVLNPASVDWILNNPSPDPSQHYLGWAFFRQSPVHLPYIGANYSNIYPYRTSVLFTDSIPLLALLFKCLGPVLPARFQYFGWWGLGCYALQGGFAQAILARLGGVRKEQTARCWATVAGAGVLVLFPALTVRMFAHTALAANWLVLLAVWLWLRSDGLLPTTRRACLVWAGMGILCAGFHLYYLPMVGIVLVGYAVRRACKSGASPPWCCRWFASARRPAWNWWRWGLLLPTSPGTPTATSTEPTLSIWWCRDFRPAGSRMSTSVWGPWLRWYWRWWACWWPACAARCSLPPGAAVMVPGWRPGPLC